MPWLTHFLWKRKAEYGAQVATEEGSKAEGGERPLFEANL